MTNISCTRKFYQTVLGMAAMTFGDDRHALRYGQQKINLHQAGAPFAPTPSYPRPAQPICVS